MNNELYSIEVPESANRKARVARQIGVFACVAANLYFYKHIGEVGFTPETVAGLVTSGVTGNALIGKEHMKKIFGIGQSKTADVTRSQNLRSNAGWTEGTANLVGTTANNVTSPGTGEGGIEPRTGSSSGFGKNVSGPGIIRDSMPPESHGINASNGYEQP